MTSYFELFLNSALFDNSLQTVDTGWLRHYKLIFWIFSPLTLKYPVPDSLVYLFNGISIFMDYLIPKDVEEQPWYYPTHSWGDIRGFDIFPKSLQVNVIAWLGFELAYFKAAVQYFSHYTLAIPLLSLKNSSECTKYCLEYSDYWPHLYCYTHNVSADMSFSLL